MIDAVSCLPLCALFVATHFLLSLLLLLLNFDFNVGHSGSHDVTATINSVAKIRYKMNHREKERGKGRDNQAAVMMTVNCF